MSSREQELTETHILGPRTTQFGVRADHSDTRKWIQSFPVCPLLDNQQIAHAGVCRAVAPYEIVRTRLAGSYFLACFGGEGRILVDGRWQRCRAGTACLLPPRILNAFHPLPSGTWEFCWVRYTQPPEQRPVATSTSPVLARFNAEPLRAAITGLHHECRGAALPALMHHWVGLIQGYVMTFAQPLQPDDRLWQLWQKVTAALEHKWTLGELAAAAHLSAEHLRRLCLKQLGRTPMQQVAFFRMQKAAELLAGTGDKVETIANLVGYENGFVFSNAFKKWVGWRPSEYRRQASGPNA